MIRIHAVKVYNLRDPTYSMWTIAVWSQLEPTLGIMCACVPFLRPVFDRWTGRQCPLNRSGTSTLQNGAEAEHLAKGSMNNYKSYQHDSSWSGAMKTGEITHSNIAEHNEWPDIERYPISSDGAIRVERSFIISSDDTAN